MKIKQYVKVAFQSALATFFVALIVVAVAQAATTIGSNITTGGTITSTDIVDITATSDTPLTVNGGTASTSLAVYQSSTGDIVNFFATSTEAFTILYTGETGVGSSTPTATLTVQAAAGKTAFKVGSTTAELFTINVSGVTVGNEDGLGFADLRWEGDSKNNLLMVDASADRVGIASTTPWGLLAVEQATETYSFIVMNQGSSTPAFVVRGTGTTGGGARVGVGTSTPSALFSIGQDQQGTGTSTMFALGFNTGVGTTTMDLGRTCFKQLTDNGTTIYWWWTLNVGPVTAPVIASSTTSCF